MSVLCSSAWMSWWKKILSRPLKASAAPSSCHRSQVCPRKTVSDWFKIQWLIFSECPDRTWCQSGRDHFRERGQAHHRHTLRQVPLDPRLLQKVPVPSFSIFHWTQNFIVLKGDFWFAKAFFIDDLSLRRPRQFATQEFDDWQFTDWQISDNLTTNNSPTTQFWRPDSSFQALSLRMYDLLFL